MDEESDFVTGGAANAGSSTFSRIWAKDHQAHPSTASLTTMAITSQGIVDGQHPASNASTNAELTR